MKLNHLLLIIVLVVPSACSFHLRGSQIGSTYDISTLYIQSLGASRLAAEVKSQLEVTGSRTLPSAKDAEYILKLENEHIEKRVLSVSAQTGKVEEFQLTLTARLSLAKPGDTPLITNEMITIERDYTFDEDSVLGKFSEERVLEADLIEQAANQIIRRMDTILK